MAGLHRRDLDADPLRQFGAWFDDAARHELIPAPEAMALATATAAGEPSVRMVLLRGHGPDGFRFFTGYESRKAGELDATGRAALLFHWQPLERQVRIEGAVRRLDPAASDAYFASRPRESQVGAWASQQGIELASRAQLDDSLAAAQQRFGGDVPRPPRWGGYLVEPDAYEFWQHGHARLHDRFRYTRSGEGWTITRLAP